MVYGGFSNVELNSGYIFDVKTHSVHSILGKQNDIAFTCYSQTVWVGKQRHVTLGLDKRSKLHLVQMQYEHQRYAEVRSIKKLGHMRENDEAEMVIEEKREAHEEHRLQLMQELAKLKEKKIWDTKRIALLEEELDLMRQQDEQKLA